MIDELAHSVCLRIKDRTHAHLNDSIIFINIILECLFEDKGQRVRVNHLKDRGNLLLPCMCVAIIIIQLFYSAAGLCGNH